MPSPNTSLATLRPDLASFEEFDLEMQRRGYIGTQVLPVMGVAKQSGTFGKITLESLLQNRSVERAPGGGYSRGDWDFGTDSFATTERGAEEPVDDRESELYSEYFDAEQVSAARAYEAVLQAQEQRIAALLFNATTWTGASLTTGVTNEWDDAANATPIDDVEAAVRKVWEGTGLWPNALMLNRLVFRNLRNCAQIIERITASGAGSPAKASDVTAQMLAAVFDLERIVVGGNPKNSAAEGQSASIAPIWSNEYAMVAKLATGNDIREPCLGRTFHWDADGSMPGGAIETYRDETVRSEIVRVRHDVHEKVLYVGAAHLLSNITT
ncbi:MAG: hypothetical protein KY476_10825 [Planctomycetes bacterium]|nr:hypothetical protein [Planctomycetota bacterium]